jgi:hypothetical protein
MPTAPQAPTPRTKEKESTNLNTFSNVAIILLEAITFLSTLFFNLALLIAAVIRPTYISLVYLLIWIVHTMYPSSFEYYRTHIPALLSIKTKPGERVALIPRTVNTIHKLSQNLFCTPRFLWIVVTLLLSLSFGITQVVFQIIFRTGVPEFYKRQSTKWLLNDIGIYNLQDLQFVNLMQQILPEILLIPMSALLLTLYSILWAKKNRGLKNQQQQQQQTTGDVPTTPEPVIDFGEIVIHKPTIPYYKRLVVFIFILLAGVLYPSLLSTPFYLLYFVFIGLYTFKIKIDSRVLYYLMLVTSIYTAGILIAFSVSRLMYVEPMRSNFWAQLVGFFDTTDLHNFREKWPGYCFLVILIFLYIMICNFCNKFAVEQYKFKQNPLYMVSMANPSLLDHKGSKRTNRRFKLFGNINSTYQYILYRVQAYIPIVLFAGLLVVTISVPSLLSMVYLLVLFLGILVPSYIFIKLLPLLLIYCFLATSLHYSFNVPGVAASLSPEDQLLFFKIGFRYETQIPACAIFFGECILAFLIAATFRFRATSEDRIPLLRKRLRESRQSRSYSTASVRGVRAIDTLKKPSKNNMWTLVSTTFQTVWRFVGSVVSMAVRFFISNSYYVALMGLYFADLTTDNADIFHAIYCKLSFHHHKTLSSALLFNLFRISHHCKKMLDSIGVVLSNCVGHIVPVQCVLCRFTCGQRCLFQLGGFVDI